LTAAEAAAAEAWADPGALTALLAKLWAGRAARLVGKQAQQVLGGMGFTWEHPFHRHARRALVLDGLLGSTTELQHELGRSLLAGHGDVPRLARLSHGETGQPGTGRRAQSKLVVARISSSSFLYSGELVSGSSDSSLAMLPVTFIFPCMKAALVSISPFWVFTASS